jgi:hypothetical protein
MGVHGTPKLTRAMGIPCQNVQEEDHHKQTRSTELCALQYDNKHCAWQSGDHAVLQNKSLVATGTTGVLTRESERQGPAVRYDHTKNQKSGEHRLNIQQRNPDKEIRSAGNHCAR